MINVEKIKPTGLFTNYIYKAIPLAFDESMSYYETLCGLLAYLKDTVIPALNNNADAIIEVQELMTQLQDYVDNYFNNLDVQEEINTKLDEMAESGVLEEIMADYLDTRAVFGFDTVADMKLATNLTNGSFARTLGYSNKNDGNGAMYKIRTITNEDIVNEINIIALADITLIAELIVEKEVISFNTVADMKTNTSIWNGNVVQTLGYYSVNDGGTAKYKIRNKTNEDVVDEMYIIALVDTNIIAELIVDTPVNAIQIGCKTDGTDNSTILNNYFTKGNATGLYFPQGVYTVSSEIDTIGSVIMHNNAWLKASTNLDCVVHINKNLVIPTGSYANNTPKNLEFKINVDGDKKALTGIRTDKLHWAKLTLTVKNCTTYGVFTRYNSNFGHSENTFNIQVLYDSNDASNTATGIYLRSSDDIYENIACINTKYGVELIGGNNSIGTIHCWLTNSTVWSGSKMLKISASKNHISNLVVDTYETGIAFSDSFNTSTGVFGLYVDFMFGMINSSFIPAETQTTYKIWDFTGLTGAARNNSALQINAYQGSDTYTSQILLGGNGICPWNTRFIYHDDYTSPTWKYDLNYCPEGTFAFPGDTNVANKPHWVTGGTYMLNTVNSSYGKIQELVSASSNVSEGATVYNTDNLQPTSNFTYFYKRDVSKWGTGNNPWGQFASYYVQSNYTPSE